MTDSIRRSVSYQTMAQPQGQNITVTFADGTTFTARYAGSGVKPMREGDTSYSYITLHMITDMDAKVSKLTSPECGAIRTHSQFIAQFPGAVHAAGAAGYPCTREKGHPFEHADQDGDTW
jgi:hypothetical protein